MTDMRSWKFAGFSSAEIGKVVMHYDNELVKRDLMNRFNTRKGERVMDADFGFSGWDLMFEHQNVSNRNRLEQDARDVFDSDPRVATVHEIVITEIDHGYQLDAVLTYNGSPEPDHFSITFDRRLVDKSQE